MGIILLKMPQWLISVFNWFTLSSMKKIIITQMLIAIIITTIAIKDLVFGIYKMLWHSLY